MKRYSIIAILLCLLLQGCDFFYSTVEYKGKEADPRLCVVAHMSPGNEHHAFVMHSEFFLHADERTVPEVNDALVTLQVNSGLPVAAQYVPNAFGYNYTDNIGISHRAYYGDYEASLPIAGNDTVRLHVEHPDYGTADAVQICPMWQRMSLTLDSLSVFGEVYAHMHLPAYTGNPEDLLSMQVSFLNTNVYYNVYIYSRDSAFSGLDNLQTASGYYAGSNVTLCVSSHDRDIAVVFDTPNKRWNDSIAEATDTLQIWTEITSRTPEDYTYRTSLERVSGQLYNRYVPDLPSERATDSREDGLQDFDIGELFDVIAEEFSVLGNAESYQVNGNLIGDKRDLQPFGCFTLTNPNVVFDYYKVPK